MIISECRREKRKNRITNMIFTQTTANHGFLFFHLFLMFCFLLGCSLGQKQDPSVFVDQLYGASNSGDIEKVKDLLEKGADPNLPNFIGGTPLVQAATNGHKEVCELLILKGANVNYSESIGGYTALLWAASNGHQSVCELLISKGADVNTTNNDGYTALHWAALKGYYAICKLLIENGAKLNVQTKEYGWTPLICAAIDGHTDVCKLLVENGADVSIKDNKGDTALGAAIEGSHSETIKYLRTRKSSSSQSSADSNIVSFTPGVTMENYKRLKTGMTYKQAVEILGEEGEEISSSDLGDIRTVMYMWKGYSLGANMNAMFQNDRLQTKAQFGLK